MTGYLTGAEAIIRALERLVEQDPSILERARDAVAIKQGTSAGGKRRINGGTEIGIGGRHE